MKKMNKKGFTLAELLIVVAIIAVLVAIAIPVFSAQLEKSREATDIANLRNGYAEAVAKYLTDGGVQTSGSYNVQQKTPSWQNTNVADGLQSDLASAANTLSTKTSGSFVVVVQADSTDANKISVSIS